MGTVVNPALQPLDGEEATPTVRLSPYKLVREVYNEKYSNKRVTRV